jgi:hypothetical protein
MTLDTQQIYVRLFRDDVELIKRLAETEGLTFSAKLRTLVRRALKAEGLGLVELDPRKAGKR